MTNQREARLRGREGPATRDDVPSRGSTARPGRRLRRFVATYGWRAYAIPILLAATVLVIVDTVTGSDSAGELSGEDPHFGTPSNGPQGTGVIGAPPSGEGNFGNAQSSGALPAGGPITARAAGTWHVVPGGSEQVGKGTERVFTYTVEVEDGMDTSGFGGDEAYARMVDQTLTNPKSWTRDERFAFRRIDVGEPSFRISLASQASTRDACGFDIQIDTSCYNQGMGRVVLDEARWVRGATAFQGDIGSYRQYQINHEIGHAIGYQEHQPCETDGGLAPIMMQQTFGIANNEIATLDPDSVVPADGKVCRFNPWPFPRG